MRLAIKSRSHRHGAAGELKSTPFETSSQGSNHRSAVLRALGGSSVAHTGLSFPNCLSMLGSPAKISALFQQIGQCQMGTYVAWVDFQHGAQPFGPVVEVSRL